MSILPDLSIRSIDRSVARVSAAPSIPARRDFSYRGARRDILVPAGDRADVYTSFGALNSNPKATTGLFVDLYV